ncbi:chaperonin 10-like protein [Pilobolus umbonatus]|nr:chaperonin 10-like protein [Pilobolus umbonatus]
MPQITTFPCASERGHFTTSKRSQPSLSADEILIEILACGVCHTDYMFMEEGLVLGHEPVGKVVAIGTNVHRFKIGEIVGTSYLKDSCLDCAECTSGQDALCSSRVMFPERSNGFATYQISNSRFAYKIPDGMDPKNAAPLMCAGVTVFNAIYNSGIKATGHIAVIGIGGLGHLAIQFAKAWGCHVTAISHSPDKREEALSFGAHEFLVSSEAGNSKFDLILNTVPQSLEWDDLFKQLKRNGTFYFLGIPRGSVDIKRPVKVIDGQLSLRGGIVGGRAIVPLMLEFAHRHHIKPVVQEFPLSEEGVKEAVELCGSGKARYRAVLIKK